MARHRGARRDLYVEDSAKKLVPEIKENAWKTIVGFLPYLWEYRYRIALALACILAAKGAGTAVPVVLKKVVDGLSDDPALFAAPALIFAYFFFRVSNSLFAELREAIFAPVSYRVSRRVLLETFRHMFSLSLSFHLGRQTGAVSRDIDRGARGISSIISFSLYSIIPTLVELLMVLGYLLIFYDISFSAIALSALTVYIIFTLKVTNWRTGLRREMNEKESIAGSKALDALINFETVKYFTNETYESGRYDNSLKAYEKTGIRSQLSLSYLNGGQSLIIAAAVSFLMWRAIIGVQSGEMSVGDLVLVNAFMIQLYMPLNFLGSLYRMITESLTDIERLFKLKQIEPEIPDAPNAINLEKVKGNIEFRAVSFAYTSRRPALSDVSFTVPAGTTTAIVGPSGAGKSTISRLLFRFYEPTSGSILIEGKDIREVSQYSLRSNIGIVPQDTVLFNDTIGFNIAYGNPNATIEEIHQAAKEARLQDFVESLPDKYETKVGERGLKLSGGEKQRVAIARAMLKNPPILVFDEATSALDSKNESAIREQIHSISAGKTVVIIAHRLSTIIHADQILVMDQGRVVESGNHQALLELDGAYAKMWEMHLRGKDADGADEHPEPAEVSA